MMFLNFSALSRWTTRAKVFLLFSILYLETLNLHKDEPQQFLYYSEKSRNSFIYLFLFVSFAQIDN